MNEKMENIGWKRDDTPYIVFECKKCNQFMYVKETQKSKKCLRCGRSHKVSDIKDNGEIVNGMTKAVKAVKERQNELALKEFGSHPEFKSLKDFRIMKNIKRVAEFNSTKIIDNDYQIKFKKVLIKLSEMYNKFPLYMIEMMAEDYGIPESEIKLITTKLIRQGILVRLNNNSYKIRID